MPSIATSSSFTADRVQQPHRRQRRGGPANASIPTLVRGHDAMKPIARHAGALVAVIALHLAVLWAFNAGLLMRPPAILIPVQLIAALVEEPRPLAVAPVTPAPQPKPQPIATPVAPKPVAKVTPQLRPEPTPAPAPATPAPPLPVAADPTPTPPAAAVTSVQTPSTTVPIASPPVAPAAPASPAVAPPPRAPVAVELPSSDAQYLQNPKPRYPPMSNKLRESGTVLIELLVTDKGVAQDARVKTSSGFFRLDDAALEAVKRWRFVPGKRGGVPETMSFTVPITFGLQ